MASTADSATGTGFLHLLHRRQPVGGSAEQQPTDPQELVDLRVHAFTRTPVDGTAMARMTSLQAAEGGPPSLIPTSFARDGRSFTGGRMPPAERQLVLDAGLRLGDAPNVVSDRGATNLRHIHPNQITDRVRQPWYMSFHDNTQEIALKHKVDETGTLVSQQILKGPYSFWTRDLVSTREGERIETVNDNYGKLQYKRECTRDGHFTITVPQYAMDEAGRQQYHRSAVRIVTSADGRDRTYRYDRGKLTGVDNIPIELLT